MTKTDKITALNGNSSGDAQLHSVFANCDREDATQQRIIENLKAFLDQGVDPNVGNTEGITCLHLAVEHQMQAVVEFLIERGANVDARDARDLPITYYFIERVIDKFERGVLLPNSPEELETARFMNWMQPKGFNFDLSTNSGLSLLHLVIQSDLQSIADTLLKYTGTDNQMLHVYLETYHDLSELRFHEFYHHKYYRKQYSLDILKTLLDRGFSVDTANARRETALHSAVKMRLKVDVLEILIDGFSAVRSTDKDRKTVLHLVIENHAKSTWSTEDYQRIVRSLIRKGECISQQDSRGRTAVQRAVANGDLQALLAMKGCGANFRGRTREGANLLHLTNGDESVVRFLVNEGVDIDGVDRRGRTALHKAARKKSVWEVLVKYGAHLDALDNGGRRPLHAAVVEGNGAMAIYLVEHGADVNDLTTMDALLSAKDVWMMEYLLKLSYAGVTCAKEYDDFLPDDPSFRRSCEREIESLRQFSIGMSTSLLDFLRMDSNRKCRHVNNEKLKSLVDGGESLRKSYPNYSSVVLGAYRQAVARKTLMQSTESAWHELTGVSLPSVCVHRILIELTNHELAIMSDRNCRVYEKSVTLKAYDEWVDGGRQRWRMK